MLTAILTTLGIIIGVGIVIIGAVYGFARIVLGIIGGAGGMIANAFNKVKK